MPYVTVTKEVEVDVDVEVELGDFDTEDLISEVEDRGFAVYAEDQAKIIERADEMEEVIWRYKTGYIEDAMILLERSFPELYGISKLIRS